MKRLGELNPTDKRKVGGKARCLSELFQAGFRVPDALVWNENELLNKLDIDQFLHALNEVGVHSVAVRSSANLEDGKIHSFAGMFESFLDLSNSETIQVAVARCVQSARNERVREYCKKNSIRIEDTQVSVLIQAMIKGSISGVAFTIDPTTGADQEIVIEAVEGSCEKLVQGNVSPDRYHYHWFNEEFRSELQGADPLLNPLQIRELSHILLQIQRFYGTPQDVEWTLLNDQFYILQSRPLTTIHFKVSNDWTNANMKDGGVASSVANPFIISLYKMMINQTMPNYFKKLRILDAKANLDWVGVFGSNIYWNLSAIKECVSQLPGFKEREFDIGLGITPNYEGNGASTSFNLKTIFKVLQVIGPMKKSIKERPKLSQAVLDYASKVSAEYADADFKEMSDAGLAKKALQLIDQHWFTVEGGYFYHIYDNANCRTLFIKQLEKGGPQKKINYLNLISSLENIPHLDPLIDLWKITEKVYRDQTLRSEWAKMSAAELTGHFLKGENFPNREEFAHFIHLNRFHSYRELDLLVPCWEEDPTQVFDAVIRMLKGDGSDQSVTRYSKQREVYLSERKKISSSALRVALDQHRNLLRIREELRIESARFFWLIRKTFLVVGERLKARGMIEEASDVFFLPYQDVCNRLEDSRNVDLKPVVQKNRLYYEGFRNFDKPNEIWRSPVSLKCSGAAMAGRLHGVGCSAGVVEGRVQLIEGIHGMHQLDPYSILVTKYIDPAWPVFLLNVRGIITEAGGILSHGAIIAREYGIPAVLSTPKVTQILKTGTRVRIDGETGVILILEND